MICVIGSMNMDLVVNVDKIPIPGETRTGKSFATISGGKGANQAVAASRMGSEVFMVARVGDDIFAETLKNELAESKVNTDHVKAEKDSASGVALISVDEEGQNNIIVVPGANYSLTERSIDEASDAIEKSQIVVLQNEIPKETVSYTLSKAKKMGKITVLNPAPARELDDEDFKNIDFLIPNEHELESLTNEPAKTEEQLIMSAMKLIEKGTGHIIITLGENGCLYIGKDSQKHFSAYKVKAVDSTAAGDSFIGGFCSSYEKDGDIEKAIDTGQKTAAMSVMKNGAQSSIPTKEEFDRYWNEK